MIGKSPPSRYASRSVMQKLCLRQQDDLRLDLTIACDARSYVGQRITITAYQNVMIIVMPIIPLANVAHLLTLALIRKESSRERPNIQHRLGQGD